MARGCGSGSVYRSREVKSGEQLAPRQALPTELQQESPCVIACLEPPENDNSKSTYPLSQPHTRLIFVF